MIKRKTLYLVGDMKKGFLYESEEHYKKNDYYAIVENFIVYKDNKEIDNLSKFPTKLRIKDRFNDKYKILLKYFGKIPFSYKEAIEKIEYIKNCNSKPLSMKDYNKMRKKFIEKFGITNDVKWMDWYF